MSANESKFIKTAASIFVALAALVLYQSYIILGTSDVQDEKIKTNSTDIQKTQTAHDKDVDKIYKLFENIREDQLIIKSDIKELLKK